MQSYSDLLNENQGLKVGEIRNLKKKNY